MLVNPAAGAGKALSLWKSVAAMVVHAHVAVEVVVTKDKGDASRLAESVELAHYDGVLIASGDGLVYEWINGVMKRPDWRVALREMPIGALPGGSGNALAKSVLVTAGDAGAAGVACPFVNATFNALKSRPPYRGIDIAAVDCSGDAEALGQAQAASTLYSFLSLAWGVVSDADIESERLRALGGARFAVMGLFRIIKLRSYRGRLSYLVADGAAAAGALAAGAARGARAAAGPPLRTLLSPLGSALVLPPTDGAACSGASTASATTPGWAVVEGDFLLLWAMNVSHGASDMHVAPTLDLDDGLIQLMWITAGTMGKCKLLELMDKLERGEHVGEAGVCTARVRAYRLEPLDPPPPGCLCVDGELVPYGPIQVELIGTQGALMSSSASPAPSAVAECPPAAAATDEAATKGQVDDARPAPEVGVLRAPTQSSEGAARVLSDATVEQAPSGAAEGGQEGDGVGAG